MVLDSKLPSSSHWSYFIHMLISMVSNHWAGGLPPPPSPHRTAHGLMSSQPREQMRSIKSLKQLLGRLMSTDNQTYEAS